MMASGGWSGAKIYDALLLRCAARCAVERIYTFHLGDSGSWPRPVCKRGSACRDPARNPGCWSPPRVSSNLMAIMPAVRSFSKS